MCPVGTQQKERGGGLVPQYGSLINKLTDSAGPEPTVGMAATVLLWSDRQPATVIKVEPFKSGARKGKARVVTVQYDTWKVTKGSEHDGSAQYEYERDENGRTETFTRSSKGRWTAPGSSVGLRLGGRERYSDPSF
jgi:hypothetical protein